MKAGFYPRLAWHGIGKNKRIYVPYILTGAVMVTVFYILSFLLESPTLDDISGGSVLRTVFPLGCAVIAIFSLLFLLYTHSFLFKARSREWGVYHILGMGKRNLIRMMIWENVFVSGTAIVFGLLGGIALSKAAELMLLNLLDMTVSFDWRIGMESVRNTAAVFVLIYAILFLFSLVRIVRFQPLDWLVGSRAGEKKMKFGGFSAVVGVLLLAGAYVLAVRIEEPVTALFTFFIAVVMVIVGTYLVFISGSVALCRLLQKNKNYYYRPNHFVSVSSMAYRMKRNGAGLASICILLTMVLVMLSSTATLYFGEEDSVRNRYPNGINMKIHFHSFEGIESENLEKMRADLEPYALQDADLTGTRYVLTAGMFTDSGILLGNADTDFWDYDRVGYLFVTSLEDYRQMMGSDAVLSDEECLLYSNRLSLNRDIFTVEGGRTYRVKEHLSDFREDGDALAMTMPSVYLVVEDLKAFTEPLIAYENSRESLTLEYEWLLGLDFPTAEAEIDAQRNIEEQILIADDYASWEYYQVESREIQKSAFFEIYGSLFFLGILLSAVFLTAAVLMIDYKQISEGYEDQSRFETMQKVGMTKREIRKSVNSQMLTVFFLPLVLAGIHLAFAFPVISKILLMFAFDNRFLNVSVTFVCFVLFGLIYAAVYKITSAGYYHLVSQMKKR